MWVERSNFKLYGFLFYSEHVEKYCKCRSKVSLDIFLLSRVISLLVYTVKKINLGFPIL